MSDKILRLSGQEFRCIPKMPPGLLMDIDELDQDEPVTRVYRKFFRTLVEDDEQERLDALLNDRRDPPTWEDILEALTDLVKEYSGRPLERPSPSPDSSETSGGSTRVVSLQRGTVKTGAASSRDGMSSAS